MDIVKSSRQVTTAWVQHVCELAIFLEACIIMSTVAHSNMVAAIEVWQIYWL